MTRLLAVEIFRDSRLRLISVKAVELIPVKMDSFYALSGAIKPTALVVCTPDETYAVDMQAQRRSLDFLRLHAEDLDDMLKEQDV